MNLGIVGHAQEKFTAETEALARERIRERILQYGPVFIVSGRSPMGGVDLYAEEIAAELGIPTIIHAPTRNRWDGPGGFKERNLAIARDSDPVLVVVCRELPPEFAGMRFEDCYHCRGRTPPHVKSGGCWTAWKARSRMWEIIE